MTLYNSDTKKWVNDHLEAFIDGQLSAEDEHRFQSLSNQFEEIEQEVELARLIATSLRSFPDENCPDIVSKNVMSHVRRDLRISTWKRIESFFLSVRATHLKPAFAVAALVLVVISSAQFGGHGGDIHQSDAEVSQALDDVKWTLAYLSGVGKTTASTVKSSVIEEQMVGPMSRSFNVLSEN